MTLALVEELEKFRIGKDFRNKGALCVALVVTQRAKAARQHGMQLNPEQLLTEGGGQVLGLGGGAIKNILARHGITRVLASEGGRTSRGNIGKMRDYVDFLNQLGVDADLDAIEKYWIDRVHDFFAGKPFKLKVDGFKSLRTVVRDVLAQAEERQREASGTQYVGAVLQHLVGAKLDCALGEGNFEHNSFSTSDEQTGREGDFKIGDVAIHVTTSPTEALIAKCQDNLGRGLRPIIVTLQKKISVAEGLAENADCGDRIDIFEIEQFIALNLYELGKFLDSGRKTAIADVVARYNVVVEKVETDPSLKIEVK